MKSIFRAPIFFLPLFFFMLTCTVATNLAAADSKGDLSDSDPEQALDDDGAGISFPVWWLPKYKPKPDDIYPHLPLWKIEYANGVYVDVASVQEKLAKVCEKGGARVLFVDMDETLRSRNSKRDPQTNKKVKKYEQFERMLPPNLRLIKAMEEALDQKAYVAILTNTNDFPWVLRGFLMKHFPKHHKMIPIIYFDHNQENYLARTTSINDELDQVDARMRKNIHATVALQLFSELFSNEKPEKLQISVALIDDDRNILSVFQENVQAHVASLDPTLPTVKKAVGIHPGEFELSKENEVSLDWRGAQDVCKQINKFLALD